MKNTVLTATQLTLYRNCRHLKLSCKGHKAILSFPKKELLWQFHAVPNCTSELALSAMPCTAGWHWHAAETSHSGIIIPINQPGTESYMSYYSEVWCQRTWCIFYITQRGKLGKSLMRGFTFLDNTCLTADVMLLKCSCSQKSSISKNSSLLLKLGSKLKENMQREKSFTNLTYWVPFTTKGLRTVRKTYSLTGSKLILRALKPNAQQIESTMTPDTTGKNLSIMRRQNTILKPNAAIFVQQPGMGLAQGQHYYPQGWLFQMWQFKCSHCDLTAVPLGMLALLCQQDTLAGKV